MSLRINPILDGTGRFIGTVVLGADVSARREAEERIEHLANHDSLTGLANRRVFEREVAARLNNNRLPETAVFLLDLDRFKAINDMLGHQTGDQLLARTGEILQGLLREDDLVARLGGDEFALLISGNRLAGRAEELAHQIVASLADPVEVGGRQLHTGASVGYLVAQAGQFSGEEALRRADLALYEAKRSGRGRAVEFEQRMNEQLRRKTTIESGLRDAIARHEIELAFQPLVSLPRLELAGFEALARWRHPDLGEIGPAEFVPVAEESGLIYELTQRTLLDAAGMAADWHARGFTGSVAVNLSPLMFRDDIVGMLGDTIGQTRCPPGALEIEITESVLLSGQQENAEKLAALRALGVSVSLDDFGTGYSSLGYLRRFPVDRIKIDRAFVEGVGRDQQAFAIVRAIAELGRALGMEVTAEGIEDQSQVSALSRAGCDRLQGYLFGRPMPRAEATEAVLDLVLNAAARTRPARQSA